MSGFEYIIYHIESCLQVIHTQKLLLEFFSHFCPLFVIHYFYGHYIFRLNLYNYDNLFRLLPSYSSFDVGV